VAVLFYFVSADTFYHGNHLQGEYFSFMIFDGVLLHRSFKILHRIFLENTYNLLGCLFFQGDVGNSSGGKLKQQLPGPKTAPHWSPAGTIPRIHVKSNHLITNLLF
jgi:hypothetical protein